MKARIGHSSLSCLAFALLLGILSPSAGARDGLHRQVSPAEDYEVMIETLPPASLAGPKAALVWDGGAQLVDPAGAETPNYRLTAFVTDYNGPVEKADVMILYRTIAPRLSSWVSLPVARMHVAGKGLDTTQYGNNVRLPPDVYQVRVSVNGQGAATFSFTVHTWCAGTLPCARGEKGP